MELPPISTYPVLREEENPFPVMVMMSPAEATGGSTASMTGNTFE
jgi:hypothetical protein